MYSDKEKNEIKQKVFKELLNGKSLRQAIKKVGKPNRDTFNTWLSKDKEMSDQYARTIELRADDLFDEIIEIADETENDFKTIEGREVVNNEAIQRSRLRVDARKWALSKMLSSKYGDKVEQTIKVEKEPPLFPDVT